VRFAVVGAGSWGTAFARLVSQRGHSVHLWARRPALAEQIAANRENTAYLPGVILPEDLKITTDLSVVLKADVIVIAVPSKAMRSTVARMIELGKISAPIISLAKGLDRQQKLRMSELIETTTGSHQVFALSGPCHAEEVGRDSPTAVVLAGTNELWGRRLQQELATPRFRVYLSDDLVGVELCATIKNIIAIATGASDGLGYGDNTRAALITRGLAEMTRFGRVFGVQSKTLFGLSGLGDLVATCTSPHSRNRAVGERLGRGESLDCILADMTMVAEGIYAAQIIHELAKDREIDMPISNAVYRLLYEQTEAAHLVDEMMSRSPKSEGS